jgi:hypothetical protein
LLPALVKVYERRVDEVTREKLLAEDGGGDRNVNGYRNKKVWLLAGFRTIMTILTIIWAGGAL